MALPKVKNITASKQKSSKKEKRNLFQAIGLYFKEVRSEFKKVMWPNRQEIASATMVVFVTLVFFVIFTGLVDLFFSGIINRLLPLIGG